MKVNERMVPLRYQLKSGDTVEIITAMTSDPAATGSTSHVQDAHSQDPPEMGR